MKKIILFIQILLLILLNSCSTGQEAIMPFHNIFYSSSRIVPLKYTEDDLAFRVWINNSTSLERVISVSGDTLQHYQGILMEIGILFQKRLFREKQEDHFSKSEIVPSSGFDNFFQKIDSLNLFNFPTQMESLPIALHQPISLYVVELKKGDQYHSFKFNTYFPDTTKTNTAYDIVESLILEEFEYHFKIK